MYGTKNDKNKWVLVIFVLAGIVLGGFIGEYAGGLPYMDWLRYGTTFGITQPVTLDAGIIVLTFGLAVKFTVAGLIGLLLSILIYKIV